MPAGLNRERLRVLLTTDAVGGVWTYALDLAAGLAAGGCETVLAVLGPAPSAKQRAQAQATSHVTLVETDNPLDWTARSGAEIARASQGLADLAARHGVDVVHLHAAALAAEAEYPVPVVVACHSCVATWWAAVRGGIIPDDLAWRAALTGRGLRRADAIFAPSSSFALATARVYGLQAPPITIANGRDAPRLHVATPPARQVLTVGRLWDPAKNAATLDAAAALIEQPVFAVGPTTGPNGEAIALRNLRGLGALDAAHVRRAMAERPVFVSGAVYEPFGLAVLEAAQAACPLVLSDIPTFRELWDGAAIFVDPSDGDGLARLLSTLLADDGRRDELGRAARRRAGRYTAQAMAAGTAALYREVLSRCRRTGTAA